MFRHGFEPAGLMLSISARVNMRDGVRSFS